MTIDELLENIENSEIQLDAGFASTPNALIGRLKCNKELGVFVAAVKANDCLDAVFNRVIQYSSVPVESGYHHPHDLTVSIYIYILIMCLPLDGVGSIEALHSKLQMIEHQIVKCRGLLYSQWTLSNAIQILNHRIVGVRQN